MLLVCRQVWGADVYIDDGAGAGVGAGAILRTNAVLCLDSSRQLLLQ